MYSSYLIYVVFILSIYLFVLCHLYFCLLTLPIVLFVVVDVVVAYSFFNLFYCSCSGSSMYFNFLTFNRTSLFMLALFIRTLYYSFGIIILYLFLFLFSLLTLCVSYSNYCHPYLYDLALVLLVWLLALLVYKFPYGDFIVN